MVATYDNEELWRRMATGADPAMRRGRAFFAMLPGEPRCKLCLAPFGGLGSAVTRLWGKHQARFNPRFCDVCETIARDHPGGCEVEMTLVFADIRGSTALAEKMSAAEFSALIQRFFRAATRAFVASDGFIDKLIGDEVFAVYLPGFAGPLHAARAIEGARAVLAATGHGEAGGPWVGVGAGIHFGTCYYGTVGDRETFSDVSFLGDPINVAARLASAAGEGEILVSAAAAAEGRLSGEGLERRALHLKGLEAPVETYVVRAAEAA